MACLYCICVLHQGESGHGSNSGSLASRGSQENGSMRSGKDSDKQSFLESSLGLNASHDLITFARHSDVSPVFYIVFLSLLVLCFQC